MEDEKYMRLALELAKKGRGKVSPNPLVGALVVRDGLVVGQGFHHRAGGPHAEVIALDQAKEKAQGACLYVTLEPCSHRGKTGPCCQAVAKAGIRRVVMAMTDPNPKVCGEGARYLREKGIEVSQGILENEAHELNAIFIRYITSGRPYVTLKTAMTADGRTASHSGSSKWITGETSRRWVHRLRQGHSAVMTGSGTVQADDPQLTCRLEGAQSLGFTQPFRVIADTNASLPLAARVFDDPGRLILLVGDTKEKDARRYRASGAGVVVCPLRDGRIDLGAALSTLAKRWCIDSVLVESGGTLTASFFAQNLWDRWLCFIAPKVIGGALAPGAVGGAGAGSMEQALPLLRKGIYTIQEDLLVDYRNPAAGIGEEHVYRHH